MVLPPPALFSLFCRLHCFSLFGRRVGAPGRGSASRLLLGLPASRDSGGSQAGGCIPGLSCGDPCLLPTTHTIRCPWLCPAPVMPFPAPPLTFMQGCAFPESGWLTVMPLAPRLGTPGHHPPPPLTLKEWGGLGAQLGWGGQWF